MFYYVKFIENAYFSKKERNVRHEKNYGELCCTDQCVFARQLRRVTVRIGGRANTPSSSYNGSWHANDSAGVAGAGPGGKHWGGGSSGTFCRPCPLASP